VAAIIKRGREIALEVAIIKAGGGGEGERDINSTLNKRASLLAAYSLLLTLHLTILIFIISRLLILL
jgi:hypothetical protein